MKHTLCAVALVLGCSRGDGVAGVVRPREAVAQLVRCTLDGVGEAPPTARFEGALRQALRRHRAEFATRAGRCETALDTEGGHHRCTARLRERWAAMLTVVQRSTVDAIDDDVAVRRVGEAYTDVMRTCPE